MLVSAPDAAPPKSRRSAGDSPLLAEPMPFPATIPAGFVPLSDEPRFDPRRHLALTRPERIWTLAELGYGPDEVAQCASPVAVTAPFRILSDEGARAIREVLLELKKQSSVATGSRLSVFVRGAVYMSRFLRDLNACQQVADHLSEIAQTPLAPHTMPNMQGYVNYAPEDLSRAVDTWHTDATGFAYVMIASDPATLHGGRFQWFHGTKAEAAAFFGTTPENLHRGYAEGLPADRINSVEFPAAGWAVFQQGYKLLHRAAALTRPGERITYVPSWVSRQVEFPDPTNTRSMRHYGQMGLLTEIARHAAWLARAKLDTLIREMPFSSDPAELAAALRLAVADATRIAHELETAEAERPKRD